MAKLPDNPLVSELFKAVHGKKTVPLKVELLKQHKNDAVKALENSGLRSLDKMTN